MYGVLPYYISKMLIDIPFLIITQVVFAIVVYWGIGTVKNVWAFIRFSFTVVLLGFTGTAFGHIISALFNQAETAIMVSPLLIIPLSILGGFYTNSNTIPSWVAWIQWVSPIRYGFEALTQNEFTMRDDVDKLAINPITFLGFTLGYAVCMIFLVTLAVGLRMLCVAILKLKVSRF
jgi:ABC-type multidrug transport system permease subunit